jgi:hypothetical protein
MASPSTSELLSARVRLPQHVVHRSFAAETVMLNLRTGGYHGLNVSAGRMLDVLETSSTVGAAIPVLSKEYGVEEELIERDLTELCSSLLDRGLIEIVDDGNAP